MMERIEIILDCNGIHKIGTFSVKTYEFDEARKMFKDLWEEIQAHKMELTGEDSYDPDC